jgi:hypothetical protein
MTKFASMLPRFGVLVALFCALSLTAFAQNNKGTIAGTVKDPNQALVKDARITVINTATRDTREATSSDDGTYTVTNLEPGTYRVSADSQGFQTVIFETVQVETNSRVPLDVNFSNISGGSNTVTVTADSTPLVESETSVRGDVITGRQVTELPIPQRNFTLLAGLSPGVTRPAIGTLGGGGNFVSGGPGNSTESTRFRESGGSVISANGARVTNNNFTLDGVDNNESQFGQIAIFPNPDAIQEFKVETSVPSAESGRAGGAIISTTFKSGSNGFHGTAYEFYQGRFASAKPANNANPPNYIVHNFGGVIGGPIFLPHFGEGGPHLYNGRNKSFFFFSYNGQRNATPAFGGGEAPVNVPTLKQRAGDFSELLRPGQTREYSFASTYTNPTGAACRVDPGSASRKLCTFPFGTIFNSNGVPFAGNIVPRSLFSTAAFNTLNAYPVPTNGGLENNYARNRSERANINQYDIKIDQNVTKNNRLFGRYSKATNERLRDNNFPLGTSPNNHDLPSGFGAGTEFGNTRQVALGDTQIFSPTIVNDARVGYSRFQIGIFNPGQGGAQGFSATNAADLGIPNINTCGITCSGAILLGVIGTDVDKQLEFIGDGSPFFFISNNFYFGDTLTVVRGNKTLKFGGDLRVRQNQPGSSGNNAKGQFQYGTSAGGFLSGNYDVIGNRDAGSSVANLLLGYTPAATDREVPGGPYFQSSKEISFFVQDDWKVRPDLTLNLGLRYDVFTPATERFNRELNFDPSANALIRAGGPLGRGLRKTDRNNFGPRLGFSYSGLREDKKLVLRGGYGLLYTTDVGRDAALAVNQPFNGGGGFSGSLANYGTAGSPLPTNFNLDTGIPLPAASFVPGPVIPLSSLSQFSDLYSVDPNLRDEHYHQFNLTAQYEFANNWLADVAYVGNYGRNLLIDRNIGQSNQRGPGSRQVSGIEFVNFTDDIGRSSYNALQTKLERRFSKGLSILAAYTWSHAIDNGPGRFAGNSTPARDRYGPVNPFNLNLEKGNSDLDVRHRFTFSNVYDLPFGRNRAYGKDIPKVVDFFFGGFQLNSVATIQSGPVYTVVFGEGGTRPMLVGDPTPTSAQKARHLEFNPGAFAPPSIRIFPNDPNSPVYGSLGRNTFRGQRQEFFDLSLFKNFHVTEGFNVQTRFQAYNVFNHVNRNVPNRNIEGCFVSGVFNDATCTANSLGAANNANIGIDTSLQRPRQLEFGIKLLF